jgi:crossover junction endodeoxyribonuclease RusA
LSGEKIILELPFAPSVNRLWRMGKGRRMYKSSVYEGWQTSCEVIIYQKRPVPILGMYRLVIEAKRPDKRRRDIDNIIKSVSDVLESTGLIENDCLCQEVTARWVQDGPEMRVIVEKIDDLQSRS